MNRSVRLFLPDSDNPYQQLQAQVARAASVRLGFAFDVDFAAGDFALQVRQIFKATRQSRPAPGTVVVMPVHESALKTLSESTVAMGIGWIYINRSAGNVAALRHGHPGVPASLITPDQHEIGRVQARQLRRLFPHGAHILYIQGRATTSSSEARAAGFRAGLNDGGPQVEIVSTLDGNWTARDAEASLCRWLQLMLPAHIRIDAVVCQSDFMAMGALDAVRAAAQKHAAPHLRHLPVLGCDGLAAVGRRLVDEGQLAATVEVPTTADRAIEMLAAHPAGGGPEVVKLMPYGYPDDETLARHAREWAARAVLT